MHSQVFRLAGVLAVVGFYGLVDPATGILPSCPFYTLTHWYCPGCGSQRALHALLHGDPGTAFGYNPLLIPAILFLLVEGGLVIMRNRGKRVRPLSGMLYTPYVVLVIVVLFWILRNIPVVPFTLLAP